MQFFIPILFNFLDHSARVKYNLFSFIRILFNLAVKELREGRRLDEEKRERKYGVGEIKCDESVWLEKGREKSVERERDRRVEVGRRQRTEGLSEEGGIG